MEIGHKQTMAEFPTGCDRLSLTLFGDCAMKDLLQMHSNRKWPYLLLNQRRNSAPPSYTQKWVRAKSYCIYYTCCIIRQKCTWRWLTPLSVLLPLFAHGTLIDLRNWQILLKIQFSSVQFSCSVMSNSLRPHELQHTRPPCPSPTPGVYSNSCPSSCWCRPVISSNYNTLKHKA